MFRLKFILRFYTYKQINTYIYVIITNACIYLQWPFSQIEPNASSGRQHQRNHKQRNQRGHGTGPVWTPSESHVDVAILAIESVGTLAHEFPSIVLPAQPAVLARADAGRGPRPFGRRVAGDLGLAAVRGHGRVGAGASVAARNQQAQVRAFVVAARVVEGGVVSQVVIHWKRIV